MAKFFDVAVIGAGPSGLLTGLCLAELGFEVALLGPSAAAADRRTAALFHGSIALLKRIGAWADIAGSAEPLEAIRLVDATGALVRAPEVLFQAREIGQPAFGYNVPNTALTVSLERLAATRLTRVVASVATFEFASDGVRLITENGQQIECRLVAAADGRMSPARTAADINVRRWQYEQSAIVCGISHSRSHKRISTEFHKRCGPLTIVPGPGKTASVVWVETPPEAARIVALVDAEFADELSRQLGGLLGTIAATTPRGLFPLSGQTADQLGRNRVALIGEAAHVIPPIGAQGLNLSFRDAAMLAEIAAEARGRGEDFGDDATLAKYDAARKPDVTSRAWTVDLLNRSLLSTFSTVHWMRGAGLFALSTIGPLRHHLMREGMGPVQSIPKLMQPL